MEAIKNSNLPGIEIYYAGLESGGGLEAGSPAGGNGSGSGLDAESLARAVSHGIEEEGLPYAIIKRVISREEARDLTKRPGLGVVVLVWDGSAAVYTRQLKTGDPLFDLPVKDKKIAGIIGKNAARIVKNKPFLDLD